MMTSLRRFLPILTLILFSSCGQSGNSTFKFVDADGDLVCDPPTDSSKFLNPERLIFAYTPVEDPAVYKDVWSEFIAHLEKTTGKEVTFFPVQSNAAQLEAMRAGRLHVTGFNTGSVPVAVNVCGFVPFTMMAAADGSFGYEMELIVPADSPIQKPEDLKGKQLAFTSPTSNSGFKAPSAILKSQFQLEAERDFEPAFSGKHDNSILGVANGDYEAAAIANTVLQRMTDRGWSKRIRFDRSSNPRRFRPRPTATRTTSIRIWRPEFARRSRLSIGKDRR